MSNDNEPVAAPTERPLRVAVCVPSFDTWHADTAMAMIGMGTYTMQYGIALAFMNEKSSMVTKARNGLAEKALSFGADYMLFVDSDLVFPADALMRLLNHQKDIVGATYNKRVPPFETLGHFLGEPRDLGSGGLIEADFLPGGFLLIKTDVLQKLPQPWFFETYYRTPEDVMASWLGVLDDQFGDAPPTAFKEQMAAIPGLRDWLEAQKVNRGEFDARYMSEDYNFCRKARKAGITVWCDLDLTFQLGHIGEQTVTCGKPKNDISAPGTQNIDLSAA